eukprot:15468831-Alexandrium_andersonii.AAC.1
MHGGCKAEVRCSVTLWTSRATGPAGGEGRARARGTRVCEPSGASSQPAPASDARFVQTSAAFQHLAIGRFYPTG